MTGDQTSSGEERALCCPLFLFEISAMCQASNQKKEREKKNWSVRCSRDAQEVLDGKTLVLRKSQCRGELGPTARRPLPALIDNGSRGTTRWLKHREIQRAILEPSALPATSHGRHSQPPDPSTPLIVIQPPSLKHCIQRPALIGRVFRFPAAPLPDDVKENRRALLPSSGS